MKAFFEEYGRTVVTVLIVLGIILVGYTIAGNGKTSAFGKFTAAVVDSLDGQVNKVTDKIPKPQRLKDFGEDNSKTYTHSINNKNTTCNGILETEDGSKLKGVYAVQFDLKADTPINGVAIELTNSSDNWGIGSQNVNLTSEWKTFNVETKYLKDSYELDDYFRWCIRAYRDTTRCPNVYVRNVSASRLYS